MNKPNYIIILLVIAIIAMYGYFSEENRKLENIILKQQDAIHSQKHLISLYNLYHAEANRIYNFPKHDSQRSNIKQPI
jgi:hypothetical protein